MNFNVYSIINPLEIEEINIDVFENFNFFDIFFYDGERPKLETHFSSFKSHQLSA